MHLFKKTIGLMAVLCVVPAAIAATARTTTGDATSRISLSSASRMPTISVKLGTTSTSTTSTTGEGVILPAALLANTECIEAYSDCIRGGDACGENFEECTTKILFHGKMAACLSTLAQCSTSGVDALFGRINGDTSGDIAKLSRMNSDKDDYLYPTDGSQLGSWITAAAISNRYDTSTCVRRYTSCLRKDSVCGEDFELCTTNTDFKKQRVFCESTLARCQDEGVKELFGTTTRSANPTKDSRIGIMIKEGGDLAAVSSVSTCYKTIDRCIENACAENPYRCYEAGADGESGTAVLAEYLDAIKDGKKLSDDQAKEMMSALDGISKKSIKGYIKNSCFTTIGANKYCYATFIGDGKLPTSAQLSDEENQIQIFDDAYEARMNESMRGKIADMVDKFDKSAKEDCTETIKSCAMRVCGGGSGPACYSQVFKGSDTKKTERSINGKETYAEIKTGCAAIVNTDMNCKYAALNQDSAGTYTYSYIDNGAFDALFPEYSTGKDPIGVVAALNSSLATSYDDAAIDRMKKQCQAVATSCIESMCGSDYVNCYRNRTDIYSDLTKTGESTYDRSMNKVGGVLDYTIVLGLCLDSVKNASVCEEHLAIEKVKLKEGEVSSWGSNTSVRSGWLDAGGATKIAGEDAIYAEDEDGNNLCYDKNKARGICGTTSPAGGTYSEPIIIAYETYIQEKAAESLFNDLIYDIEKKAQATYNSKLTKEQHMCISSNNGGISGYKDMGSTFMWVKLKSNKVPKGYNVNGLQTSEFTASNDLYGSFCRVRVTLQSDDKKIQEAMKNEKWTTAYFAVGDSFTCGSWIPEDELNKISEKVAAEKTGKTADGKLANGQGWLVAGASILSAVGGGVGMDALQTSTGLGGLLKTTNSTTNNKTAKIKNALLDCENKANAAMSAAGVVVATADGDAGLTSKVRAMNNAMAALGTSVASVNRLDNGGYYVGAAGLTGSYNKATAESAKDIASGIASSCSSYLSNISGSTGDESWWQRDNNGRRIMNAVGAAATGVTGLFVTRDMIRESNKAQFTAAQQEWMNNVGRHITCYIGGDEAGEYGDIITTSLE